MCGRFTQYNSREEYQVFLGEEAERDIPYDPEPVGRYNVAPGTRVLLLSERRSQLHVQSTLGARTSHCFFTDGWFEWKQQNGVKQPFFIYRKDGNPLLLAAIGKPPFENGNDQEGFLIVTAAADEGLLDIHDRRPLVYSPAAARKWLSENTTGKEAEEIAREGSLSAEDFTWHPVSRAIGNPRNQGRELIEPLA
ncbi:SOS response-associated peptidase family protein [Escherichia coli]|nr:SOS response-associated peptidase family protein [Escherichia coli]MBB9855420.1 SOS response-associated peptidase family protein [Escherichia coli]MDY9722575.1 SOS response-associated peptidase family protein [Escherichia coli]MDZ3961439.1 SOS response-associated peptidase family protein [Escherichia coli]